MINTSCSTNTSKKDNFPYNDTQTNYMETNITLFCVLGGYLHAFVYYRFKKVAIFIKSTTFV